MIDDTKTTDGCQCLEPVTASFAMEGAINFNVPAGVPMNLAFDELSALFSAGLNAVHAAAMDEENEAASALWSGVLNLKLAFALLQAMHDGYIQHLAQGQVGATSSTTGEHQ